MTSHCFKDKVLNSVYAIKSVLQTLITCPVPSHSILFHRDTLLHYPTLALFPILQHTVWLLLVLAHADATSPDLTSSFRLSEGQFIHYTTS